MFVNVLFLVIFIGLTIGAGWLTFKAWRVEELRKRIAGTLGSGLLTLILTAVSFFGAKGISVVYFPGADPAPDLTVEGTPEQIARGEYLAKIGCIGCHGTYEGDFFKTDPAFPMVGGLDLKAVEESLPPIGQLVTENLTPGGKLANYSDGEIFRAIRHGFTKDGHRLGFMPLLTINQISDEDLIALIAFIRIQSSVEPQGPTGTKLNFLGMLFYGAGLFPISSDNPGQITASAPGPNAEYGEYVATFGDCRGCHGPDMTGMPGTSFSAPVPNPRPFVSLLTLEQFTEMMRSGIKPGGTAFRDGMPWKNASRMVDEDLEALYLYLTKKP